MVGVWTQVPSKGISIIAFEFIIKKNVLYSVPTLRTYIYFYRSTVVTKSVFAFWHYLWLRFYAKCVNKKRYDNAKKWKVCPIWSWQSCNKNLGFSPNFFSQSALFFALHIHWGSGSNSGSGSWVGSGSRSETILRIWIHNTRKMCYLNRSLWKYSLTKMNFYIEIFWRNWSELGVCRQCMYCIFSTSSKHKFKQVW